MTARTATEARAELPALLDAVETGEEVIITRHGRPVAVLIHPDALRVRRTGAAFAQAAQLRADIEAARNQPLDLSVGITPERADELVAELRGERDQE